MLGFVRSIEFAGVDCRDRRINPFHSTDNRANRHHIPLVWALSGGGMVSANQQQQDGPAHCGWGGEGNKPTISGLCSAFGRNCPRNPRDIELVALMGWCPAWRRGEGRKHAARRRKIIKISTGAITAFGWVEMLSRWAEASHLPFQNPNPSTTHLLLPHQHQHDPRGNSVSRPGRGNLPEGEDSREP